MPEGFHRWVLRHEVYHSVLRHMLSKGIRCVVPGTERTPGHWMRVVLADGREVSAGSIVQTRWPSRTWETLQSLAPGGMRPQDAWPGSDDWENTLCHVPDLETVDWLKIPPLEPVDGEEIRARDWSPPGVVDP